MHLGRTGDARALDHREPDRAAADHPHARARPDLRRLEHRADAGRDRAADQAGLDERNAVHADRGALVHHRARREGPRAERAGQGATVGEPHARPGGGRRPTAAHVAARAPAALAARRAPADHDPVAHAHGLDSRPDGLDDACPFVPEQDRRRVGEPRLEHVQVAVADAARLDADEHLVLVRVLDLDLDELEATELLDHDSLVHATSLDSRHAVARRQGRDRHRRRARDRPRARARARACRREGRRQRPRRHARRAGRRTPRPRRRSSTRSRRPAARRSRTTTTSRTSAPPSAWSTRRSSASGGSTSSSTTRGSSATACS